MIGLYFLIWYGTINDNMDTDTEKNLNYASERGTSELGKSLNFPILKLLFPSIIILNDSIGKKH